MKKYEELQSYAKYLWEKQTGVVIKKRLINDPNKPKPFIVSTAVNNKNQP